MVFKFDKVKTVLKIYKKNELKKIIIECLWKWEWKGIFSKSFLTNYRNI